MKIEINIQSLIDLGFFGARPPVHEVEKNPYLRHWVHSKEIQGVIAAWKPIVDETLFSLYYSVEFTSEQDMPVSIYGEELSLTGEHGQIVWSVILNALHKVLRSPYTFGDQSRSNTYPTYVLVTPRESQPYVMKIKSKAELSSLGEDEPVNDIKSFVEGIDHEAWWFDDINTLRRYIGMTGEGDVTDPNSPKSKLLDQVNWTK